MIDMLMLVMVLIGMAISLGLLKTIPYIKMISWILGIIGSILLIGLAIAAVGIPQVFNFFQNIPWLYALVVGLLGGSALAGLIPG